MVSNRWKTMDATINLLISLTGLYQGLFTIEGLLFCASSIKVGRRNTTLRYMHLDSIIFVVCVEGCEQMSCCHPQRGYIVLTK